MVVAWSLLLIDPGAVHGGTGDELAARGGLMAGEHPVALRPVGFVAMARAVWFQPEYNEHAFWNHQEKYWIEGVSLWKSVIGKKFNQLFSHIIRCLKIVSRYMVKNALTSSQAPPTTQAWKRCSQASNATSTNMRYLTKTLHHAFCSHNGTSSGVANL